MRDNVRLLLGGLLETVRLDPFDLLDGLLGLRRFTPNVSPVSVTDTRGKASTNGVEHILRGVGVVAP